MEIDFPEYVQGGLSLSVLPDDTPIGITLEVWEESIAHWMTPMEAYMLAIKLMEASFAVLKAKEGK